MQLSKVIIKPALIFVSSFLIMYTLCYNVKGVQKGLAKFNAGIGQMVFNTLNPEVFCDFEAKAPPNPHDYDFTFHIYDLSKQTKVINSRTVRRIPGNKVILQKHFTLFIIPFIFLTALALATPIPNKIKLIRYLIAVVCVYIIISLHLSYRFELVLTDDNFKVNSIWTFISWIGGLGGTYDNLFVLIALVWLLLIGWPLFNAITSKLEK